MAGHRWFLVVGLAVAFWAAVAPAQTFDGDAREPAPSIVPSFLKQAGSKQAPSSQSKISAVASEVDGLFEAVDEKTYVVGPGDYLQIVFGIKNEYVTVNPEGYVVIESAPPVQVAGKTLLQAKREIQKAAATQYKSDRVQVTLAQAKVFQVSMAGEIVNPGLYSFESGVRLSTALERAGGFSYLASRRVQIVGADGASREQDLGSYYRDGDLQQNPYLNQGDRILAPRVDFSRNVVYVRAEKGLSAIETSPGESLEEILRRHENFKTEWEWLSVRIYVGDRYRETVLRKDASAYVPVAGATLEPYTQKKVVFVGGTVVQPGYIDYNPAFGAYDYIAKAGITVNTSRNLRAAEIVDTAGNVRKIQSSRDPVHPGDHIWVPRSTEAKTRDYVGLISSVSSLAVAIATLYVLVGTQ